MARSSSTLTAKRCEPCESDAGSMGYMGLCGSLQRPQIEELLEEVRGRSNCAGPGFRICKTVQSIWTRSVCHAQLSMKEPAATDARDQEQVNGWELREDEQKRLRLRRRLVAKNFAAALQLCERIGALAESEGHHPDLHITVNACRAPCTSLVPLTLHTHRLQHHWSSHNQQHAALHSNSLAWQGAITNSFWCVLGSRGGNITVHFDAYAGLEQTYIGAVDTCARWYNGERLHCGGKNQRSASG